MNAPVNGDDFLARVKPVLKEHRVQICLRPDLVQRWEQLNEQLAESRAQSAGGRLSDGKAATAAQKKLAKDIVALEAEIDAASAWFTFRALPAADFRALCAEFPPRKDNQIDQITGYDRDAVADALIRRCLVDPVFSEAGWAEFMSVCAPTEWQELRDGVFEANGGTEKAPKSRLASEVLSRRASVSA